MATKNDDLEGNSGRASGQYASVGAAEIEGRNMDSPSQAQNLIETGFFQRVQRTSRSLILPSNNRLDISTEEGQIAEAPSEGTEEADTEKQRKIEVLLKQCRGVRFPFRKKLMMDNMNLRPSDIPLDDLVGSPLGNTLHKLSLTGNRLMSIPDRLVQSLPLLKHLDLSQCHLATLPTVWVLPRLRELKLSQNRISEFPRESILEGIPDLQELDLYGNRVSEIIVPPNAKLLSRLEVLNLGDNNLQQLPEELDRLGSLRRLQLRNNSLESIPRRLCYMDLKSLDVSGNPVVQPPLETCKRGIHGMRRYYQNLEMEKQRSEASGNAG